MKASIRNALIVTVLAMMAVSVVACFSSSSADSGGSGSGESDWDEARVSALEDQVEDLVATVESQADEIAGLEDRLANVRVTNRLRVGDPAQAARALGAAYSEDDGLATIGEVIAHLPGSEPMRTGNFYEALSTTGYLFELRATSAAEPVVITNVGSVRYESPDCSGQGYLHLGQVSDMGAQQGFVTRYPGDDVGEDPADYIMVPAGATSQMLTFQSQLDSQGCGSVSGPETRAAFPVQPNDPELSGVPSEPLMGPTIVASED